MERYVIVRCHSSNTVQLANELYSSHGIEAWTPHFTRRMRLPRGKPRRTILKPILPGFVFIGIRFLEEAQALSDRRLVVQFRVLIVNGAVATVGLRELKLIRDPAYEKEPDGTAPDIEFASGDRVRIAEGPFAGLTGRVTGATGDYIELECADSIGRVKIPSWMIIKCPV